MKKFFKRLFIALGIALVVIQFIRPAKNNNPEIGPNHIAKLYAIPPDVDVILQKACYDCHSNNTRYPWYSNIQPVAWWLKDHIDEAKEEMNFSEFGAKKLLWQSKKLRKSSREVDEGEMPLRSYTYLHRDAILTHDERQIIDAWFKSLSEEIRAKVPPEEIAEDKKRQEERRKAKEAEGEK